MRVALSPTVAVVFCGCVAMAGGEQPRMVTVAVELLVEQLPLAFVALTQKLVVLESGPVGRIVPKLKYSSEARIAAITCSSFEPAASALTQKATCEEDPARRRKRENQLWISRVLDSVEVRITNATVVREPLASSAVKNAVSTAVGDRPRTSL